MSSTQCDRDTFLRNLRQSVLISSRDLRKVIDRLPQSDRGRVVARALVDAGLLTRFQAELLLVGRTHGFFLGQYKILDQLGQGGMGRVYKAVHMTMKRVVAIKVLAPQLVQTAKAMKMFKNEVRAAARLHHPNIVTAFDANQVKGRHYLVMEFVDGPNLDQLVRQRTHLSIGLACEVIRQTAVGLQYAQDELGLVHRDIKPANLLLQKPSRPSAGPVVKILDFGLARLQDAGSDTASDSKDNTIIGTPDFLSPEQSRNLPNVDVRSDIYSLGCTFYFLLTGRVPFPGGPTLEKLMRHASEDPVTVALFRSDVPEAVLGILSKMLAKKLEDRYQTPQEVAQALAPFAKVAAADLDFSVPPNPIVTPSLPSSAELSLKPPPASQVPTRGPQATVAPDNSGTPLSEEFPFPFVAEDDDYPHRLPGSMWLLIVLTLIICGLSVGAAILYSQ